MGAELIGREIVVRRLETIGLIGVRLLCSWIDCRHEPRWSETGPDWNRSSDRVGHVNLLRFLEVILILCLPKTLKYLSRREFYLFPNLSFDPYFSRRTARRPAFGRSFS